MNSKPKRQLILSYQDFFGEEPPEDRLSLIRGFSKKHLLYEIAGLNFRLFEPGSLRLDLSKDRQAAEISYFFEKNPHLHEQYFEAIYKHVDGDDYPWIFNRACNLFALEEILNADEFVDIEGFEMTGEVFDGIFRYLLAVNSQITKIKRKQDDLVSLESINADSIVLNELIIEDNPAHILYRGVRLLDYFSSHPFYGNEIKEYFDGIFNDEPHKFIFELLSMYFNNRNGHQPFNFYYRTLEPHPFLDYLSNGSIKNKDFVKLLTVKKSPVYKDVDNRYIVLDMGFLISKGYDFFINDFWFDHLKVKTSLKIDSYKGHEGIGSFFEGYVEEILKPCFSHLKYPKPMFFDDLKIKVGKEEPEVADIYIRQNKKVLVGQVKASPIYDNEKYSGEFQKLYKNNREDFFDKFGVNQVVTSIKNILKHYSLFDPNLPRRGLEFYPIIVLNDKIFKTPFFANVFNDRFQELIKQEKMEAINIRPLTVAHISDLEYLEDGLIKKNVNIWDLLKYHTKHKPLIPPFYKSLEWKVKSFFLVKKNTDTLLGYIKKYALIVDNQPIANPKDNKQSH